MVENSKHVLQRLSDEDYQYIFSRVPRLCIDLVIHSSASGVLLLKRKQKPYIGSWHIPGGCVKFRESIADAANRIALAEIGETVNILGCLGYMEFHYDKGDLVEAHSVSLALDTSISFPRTQEEIPGQWFNSITGIDIHPGHQKFLASLGYNNG